MENIKIISISIVRNEADIIEEFVRYNLNFLDEMYIIDHLSTDNTLEILLKLKEEGLPIKILEYKSYRKDQWLNYTQLQDYIRKKYNVDYIMFIDADEFITAKSKEDLVEILSDEYLPCIKISMIHYAPKKVPIDKETLYHKTFIYFKVEANQNKSIINVKAIGNKPLIVKQGGHEITYEDGETVPYSYIYGFHLAHFDERSKEQIKSKYLIGALAYLHINPDFIENIESANIGSPRIREMYIKMIKEYKIDEIDMKYVTEDDIKNYIYILNPLKVTCIKKYSNLARIDSLDNCINYFVNYLKYNNDEIERRDLIKFIKCLNTEDNSKALIEVVKKLEDYIKERNNKNSEKPGNLFFI